MPLVDRTNEGGRQPSPGCYPPSRIPVGKTVQRNRSIRRVSSEAESLTSIASPSDSIYNALPAEAKNSDLGTHVPVVSGGLAPTTLPDDNVHDSCELEPIIEQKSFASLRRSKLSLKQKASVISQLSGRVSIRTLRERVKSRRKSSFSADDMPNFPSDPETTDGSSIAPQTYPASPVEPPPLRPPTPIGLPTFNTAAASSYRLPPPRVRLRDAIRGRWEEDDRYREQTRRLPLGAIMRSEDGSYIRGSFHAPRSGQTFVPSTSGGDLASNTNWMLSMSREVPGNDAARNQSSALSPRPSQHGDGRVRMVTQAPVIPQRTSSRPLGNLKRKASWLCCCSTEFEEADMEEPIEMREIHRNGSDNEDLDAQPSSSNRPPPESARS